MRGANRCVRAAALACLTATLLGCAAPAAFREGQAMVAEGRLIDGMARLEDALRLDPANAAYRIAWRRARDRYTAEEMDRAQAWRKRGDMAAAESSYRSVLRVHDAHEGALAGLRGLANDRRLAGLLDEADLALARKDIELARERLRAVAIEQPDNERALALTRQLEPERARPPAAEGLASGLRKPISIEFKDASLKTIFEVFSRTSGLNFVLDKDLRGDQKATIFLRNASVEDALETLLLTHQLDKRILGPTTLLIYPNTAAKQKDYQPLSVRSFYLANADAKTVAAAIKSLLKSRDIVVDDKLNLLVMRDSLDALRIAEKIVALHDVPEPEVMLELEILEVKRSKLLDLGIRWPDALALSPLPASAGGALTVAQLRALSSPGIAATVGPVTLNARKGETDANILANPRIRARNREKAKILIGSRVPNITTTSTSTGFVAESVNYLDVGLKLEVEPSIHLDGEVAIKVALEVSSIISQVQTKSGTTAYEIGTRTAQTVLRLKDGENEVLAGLINDEDRRNAEKLPGLGEVPLLGRLFGSQQDNASKTEIVLSITPRILRNLRRPEAGLAEFESGTESSLGARVPGLSIAVPEGAGSTSSMPSTSSEATAGARPASSTPPYGTASPSRPASSKAPSPGGDAPSAPERAEPATIGSRSPASAALSALSAMTPQVRWQGPVRASVGDSFDVHLWLEPAQPIGSVSASLAFDARVLQVLSVQEGGLMRQGKAATRFHSRIDPSGQVLISVSRNDAPGAASGGELVTLTLRAIAGAHGVTALRLPAMAWTAPGGQPQPVASMPPYELVLED